VTLGQEVRAVMHEALHVSRRCQAIREIHCYQQLIHYAREFVAPREVESHIQNLKRKRSMR